MARIDDKLADKLRKVLALTTSPNENEAAAAAAALARLLQEHNLSMADLEKRGAAAPPVAERGHDLGKAAFRWKLDLADGIADFYYCAPLVDRREKTVRFVGRPDNVEGLLMLYPWVIDQVKRLSATARKEHEAATAEHIDPLRWQIGFGEGAVERLIDRLREMKAQQAENVARNDQGDVVALALHHGAENSDYLEAKYGYRTDGKETREERERRERYEAKVKAKADMRARCKVNGDMEPYYAAYPWERPDAIARRQEQDAEWQKRREKSARQRRVRTARARISVTNWEKEEQSGKARISGRENADKVNLQPFLRGEEPGRGRLE